MKNILKESDSYKTTDLVQCCCLIYFNHLLEAIDRFDTSRCVFLIKREEQTDRLIEDFHKGLIRVEPKRFCAIRRDIMGRINNN